MAPRWPSARFRFGSKHAIVGFTESVITELLYKHSKVRVAMVHMPALNTIQFN